MGMSSTPRPAHHIAKMTSKNQLTLPAAVVAALGHPSHFRVQLAQGALILFPGRVTSDDEVCARLKRGGMAEEAVEQVRAALERR